MRSQPMNEYGDMARDEAVEANIIEGENWRDFDPGRDCYPEDDLPEDNDWGWQRKCGGPVR